jgi:transcriptional regulator with XRE-family HTH domain
MKAFGERLKGCRIAAGYETAEELAQALEITSARYRRYERGEVMPPIDILEMLCRRVEKSADFLLFGPAQNNS